MKIANSQHRLDIGGLAIPTPVGDPVGWKINLLADGHSMGSGDPVVKVVAAMFGDGDQEMVERIGNAESSIPVVISAPTLTMLYEGEAALRQVMFRPTLITWTPPDGMAPKTCFVVVASWMTPVPDDLALLRCESKWVLTFRRLPHARSEHPTTIEPLPTPAPTPTIVLVDDCNVTGGTGYQWTSSRAGVPGAASTFWEAGAIGPVDLDLDSAVTSPEVWTLTRTGTISFDTGGLTRYLVVQARTVSNTADLVAASATATDFVGSRNLTLVHLRMLSGGYYEFTYLLPEEVETGSKALTSVTFTHVSAPGDVWGGLLVRGVSRTDAPPSAGGGKQVIRTIDVGGTERGPVDLHISSPTSSDLGHAIIATWQDRGDGFDPSMRRRRANGNAQIDDATTISGQREAIGPTGVNFFVPAASVAPGTYALIGRMRSVNAGTRNIYWQAQTYVESTVMPGIDSDSFDHTFNTPLQWEIVPIGLMTLPVVAATSGDLFFGINHAGSTEVEYDELWLLPADTGCAVTALYVGASHVWLRSPAATTSGPSVMVGDTESGSNARHPGPLLVGEGAHEFEPGRTSVFVATSGDKWPRVGGQSYHWWTLNAAD